MIKIQLLEDTDTIHPDDWCRPLNLQTMIPQSDYYSFINTYGGTPEHNLKWIQVKDFLVPCWFGKLYGEFLSKHPPVEFIRGDMPKSHQFDMVTFNRENQKWR